MVAVVVGGTEDVEDSTVGVVVVALLERTSEEVDTTEVKAVVKAVVLDPLGTEVVATDEATEVEVVVVEAGTEGVTYGVAVLDSVK